MWQADAVSRRGSARAALLAVSAVALFACLGTAHAASVTLTVDDDGAQCPSAPYSSIEDALADASPGDTIVVCPGTYDPTEIDVSVTLRGFTQVPSADDCANPDYLDPNPAQETVVDGGLTVSASNLTITGFTIVDGDSGVSRLGRVERRRGDPERDRAERNRHVPERRPDDRRRQLHS